jgi:hypothetical protein
MVQHQMWVSQALEGIEPIVVRSVSPGRAKWVADRFPRHQTCVYVHSVATELGNSHSLNRGKVRNGRDGRGASLRWNRNTDRAARRGCRGWKYWRAGVTGAS